uniref:Uncharacterized protein n=1 Tax=Klebsiella pneumoniae TaxID=573 RepID=A0A2P1BPQ7_KLEPN|nr:hypothetical protein [Klebsiella pneumoniae]
MGVGNPRKFRHSALWNFFGVVRGMTTRQRLPHLSEALWRDAETPGIPLLQFRVRNSSSVGGVRRKRRFFRNRFCVVGKVVSESAQEAVFLVCLATVA